ncbi:hypothetical protein WN51_02521 [Melipona quadrifasciata]|uniref:Uncharacterized protein n=1 Tax=Melipona quadrifasciata TaxID=166423 RepID=A0A0M8ZSW9_9HYME|nr:hypothetical protein WN51_02521 [Melipona quadrifasciata]
MANWVNCEIQTNYKNCTCTPVRFVSLKGPELEKPKLLKFLSDSGVMIRMMEGRRNREGKKVGRKIRFRVAASSARLASKPLAQTQEGQKEVSVGTDTFFNQRADALFDKKLFTTSSLVSSMNSSKLDITVMSLHPPAAAAAGGAGGGAAAAGSSGDAGVERCQRPRVIPPPPISPRSIVRQVPPEFVPARCRSPSARNAPPAAPGTREGENDEMKENSRAMFLSLSIAKVVNIIVQTKSLILRLNDDDLRLLRATSTTNYGILFLFTFNKWSSNESVDMNYEDWKGYRFILRYIASV